MRVCYFLEENSQYHKNADHDYIVDLGERYTSKTDGYVVR
jgi:hypothetical protein